MKKKNISIILSLIIVAIITWWGLSFLLPPVVATTSMTKGPAVEAVYATGTIEPTIMVPISPRTTSRLTALYVDEGRTVNKGDVLAQLEDNDITANIAEIAAKLAFAENDLKRQKTLFDLKVISANDYETANANRDALIAQLNAAKAKASYMQLIAPADGLIIKRDGEIGQIINAGTPVFYFTCCAPLRISAEVDEENIARVKIDMPVLIQSDNFPDKIYHGRVSSITPKGDPISRSYRVRIAFDDDPSPFMIGMTGEVNIILRKNDHANLIPTGAINAKGEVQIISNNMVNIIKPVIGSKGVAQSEIISGLKPDDKVVVPYNPNLKDGDRVRNK